ncbi:MAG TPA: SDR family oxidoreductase [Opitutaceae bacterium]|nr:SDR family oxidoreductase [Opitutaceae bacterium]
MENPRVIVITGCTRGLGRALVDEFIAAGHTVVGCGRGAQVMELRMEHGEPHDFSVVDVSQETKVAIWAEKVIGVLGAPDILINNAALMNTPAPLWKISAREFDALMDVNIKGVANIIRHFVPAMVARKKGVVVNLSSGWGRSVSPEVAPYCATKYAIEGLTKALAEELPAGMAAVPLSPGMIDTDMLRQAWSESAGAYPKAAEWAGPAAKFILKLGPRDNGKSLSVPAIEV